MKNKLYIILVSVILFSLQVAISDRIKVCEIKPDLVVLFVIALSFYANKSDLFFGGLFCGLLQDVVLSKSIGVFIVINLIFCMILKNNERDTFVFSVAKAFVFFFLYEGLILLFCSFPNTIREFWFVFRKICLGSAIYNTVCFVVLFAIVRKKRKIESL